MPRKGGVVRRETPPDPVYGNPMVTRIISSLMVRGKRSLAERIFYDAMKTVEERTGQEPMTVLKQAMNNVKPMLEVKSRRVGGANYQVPVEVRPDRRNALAIRWLILYSRQRAEKTMSDRLAQEILAAAKNEGSAVKKREDTHRMAEANKAFAHYRW
jgi:small subunit ribosomal protein S7